MSGLAEVVKAADFAARKHKDQRRKGAGQVPYINHPLGVAHILMSEGGIDDPIGNVKLFNPFLMKYSKKITKKIVKLCVHDSSYIKCRTPFILTRFFFLPTKSGNFLCKV